jgi:multimeric flavodoxin WrbA
MTSVLTPAPAGPFAEHVIDPPSRFRAFAEATSGRWQAQAWKDKLSAGFTNSACKAGDKHSTLAAQHQMTWVNLVLPPGWYISTGSENDLNHLGYFTGAAATTAADLPVDAVHKADLATAEHLGARIAHHAAVVLTGRETLGV